MSCFFVWQALTPDGQYFWSIYITSVLSSEHFVNLSQSLVVAQKIGQAVQGFLNPVSICVHMTATPISPSNLHAKQGGLKLHWSTYLRPKFTPDLLIIAPTYVKNFVRYHVQKQIVLNQLISICDIVFWVGQTIDVSLLCKWDRSSQWPKDL